MLADRVAASKYSPQAFEDGLTHVIRRQVEFEDVVYWEITNAQKAQRTVQNLYELKVSEEQGIEEKIKEAIRRPTSEDDTHPSPAERFRLARRVTWNNELPLTGMVWDLFTNRAAITDEMSSLINNQVKAVSGG